MIGEISTGLSLVATALGIVALLISNRNAGLKEQLGKLRRQVEEFSSEVEKLTARLAIVENERDGLKRSISTHVESRIEVLDENRELHKQLLRREEKIIGLTEYVAEMRVELQQLRHKSAPSHSH